MSNHNTQSFKQKNIAMVAHDHEKKSLLEWAKKHRDILEKHHLCATGTTGKLLEETLQMSVHKFKSGPLGGDLEVGAYISEGKIDVLIFFWDPLEPQPHDPDVKALLRIAAVWNVPVACNRASADYLISSPLIDQDYQRIIPDFEAYNNRFKNGISFDKN